jgi:hypothetical protein
MRPCAVVPLGMKLSNAVPHKVRVRAMPGKALGFGSGPIAEVASSLATLASVARASCGTQPKSLLMRLSNQRPRRFEDFPAMFRQDAMRAEVLVPTQRPARAVPNDAIMS